MHRHAVEIAWGHCDPAGIVYFPRYFEMFHSAMETWFGAALGHPYRAVIVDRRLGFPSVHTEADFRRPSRFGDHVVVELRLLRIGTSSIALGYTVVGDDGEIRATGRTVCAVMDLDPASPSVGRGVPLPDDLRAAMVAFGVVG